MIAQPDERGQLRNGCADLRELGLGEVDVRIDESAERVPRGAELGTNAPRPFGGLGISRGRVRVVGVGARIGVGSTLASNGPAGSADRPGLGLP